MNSDIRKLCEIVNKPVRNILGSMSETSRYSLDIARCEISGFDKQINVVQRAFDTFSCEDDFKKEVKEVLSKEQISLKKLCLLHHWIAGTHSKMILSCLKKRQLLLKGIDFLESPGQNLNPVPKKIQKNRRFPNPNLQIGNRIRFAVRIGNLVISDYGQKYTTGGRESTKIIC